jgi:shikimate dehydrogenase
MAIPINSDGERGGVYGLLGYDVGYSMSPAIFRTVFDALAWRATFAVFDLGPRQIRSLLRSARATQILGLSVTIPYKTRVIPYLDSLSDEATAVGAVNAIATTGGKLVGHNTDVQGIVAALALHRKRLRGRSALIFGAGGAARAVAYALVNDLDMSQITVAARSTARARRMIHHLQDHLSAPRATSAAFAPTVDLKSAISEAALIVNATPLGGMELADRSPLPPRLRLSRQTIVFDLVYRPRMTKFVKQARQSGCRFIVGGWPMLVAQAEASFHVWTGRGFPKSVRTSLARLDRTL